MTDHKLVQQNWYSFACHALYSYKSDDLQLLLSNLENEHESNLQLFLMRRLKKGAIYIGSGNFSVMEFSLDLSTTSPATCFYMSLPCGDTTQTVCCLIAPPEAHLELFRSELQSFSLNEVEKLKTLIPSKKTKIEDSAIQKEFQNWPYYCIDFLSRVIVALGTNIANVLQVALQSCKLEMCDGVNPQLVTDIKDFVRAASVADLVSSSTSSHYTQTPSSIVNVKMDQHGVTKDIHCSSYCQEWAKLLIKDPTSAANIKKVLESFKLKTIKDINMLRRLLKQAETDHYSLYSACSFLRQSGNSKVLLCHAQEDGESPEDVINILQKYLSLSPTIK